MRFRNWAALAGFLSISAIAGVASASSPFGVWAKVEKVVVEKSDGGPNRIQIHGVFMLFVSADAGTFLEQYTPPAHGVMYFECPAGQTAICEDEWADIEKSIAAGPRKCVGFGAQLTAPGTLHAPGAPLGNPDPYPIHNGVNPDGVLVCEYLADFIAAEADGGSGGAGGAGGSGTAGTSSGGTGGSGSVADAAAGTGGASGTGGTGSAGTAGSGGTAGKTGSAGSAGSGDEEDGCALAQGRVGSWGALSALGAALLLALGRARRKAR
jgi:hypothetical protein